MAKANSESGHAINLSNFKVAIDVCTDFGVKYNPGNDDITVEAMTALWNSGEEGQQTLIAAVAATKMPIANRELLFKGLSPLVTRVMGVVNSSKTNDKMKADLKAKADAIRGHRKKKKTKKEKAETAGKKPDTADEALKKISQSQMSFVQRTKSFFELIQMLITVPEYKVNEKDLQVDSLTALYTQMKAANEGMGGIINAAKMGLIKRDRVLYAAGTGIIDIARACKSYVKGLYGAESAELKLLTKLQFRDSQKKVVEELNGAA